MKDSCSGAAEGDDLVGKSESSEHFTDPNGTISNDAAQNTIKEEYLPNKDSLNNAVPCLNDAVPCINDAVPCKESYTDSNEERTHEATCEVVLKEENIASSLEESKDNQPPQRGRRSSRLQEKQPRLCDIIACVPGEILDFVLPDKRVKRRAGKYKRHIKQNKDPSSTASKSEDSKPRLKSPSKGRKRKRDIPAIKPEPFTAGAFVVIKTDYHSTTTPAIWKIDGKALLQKYVHFDQDGEILYKNTTTYSGWTINNKDQYYPAEVEVQSHKRNETIVKFKRELIIPDDSE